MLSLSFILSLWERARVREGLKGRSAYYPATE